MAGQRNGEQYVTTVVSPSDVPGRVNPDAATLDVADFGERYKPIRAIARGGMGEVRLCRDERIGREVALKVMAPEREPTDELRARFLREARVQGQLEHPAIVPVYEVGRDERGREFFTMRCLRGWTLLQVLNHRRPDAELRRRFPRAQLLGAFQQICLAVDYAHKHGVLHRDIKPANVMLGEFGEVYLLDWGVAKLRERARDSVEPGGSSPTSDGQVLGTPGYMPPEQAAGERDVDERADVYALGALLFEIVAGVPLHEGSSSKELLRSTHVGANARVSERAAEGDVLPEIDAICERATALEARDRYASARELHDALQRVLDGERDLSLRRGLARRHADAARQALERALRDDDVPQRALALREVGQALALAPDDPEVGEILSALLTRPPRELPADAHVEAGVLDTESRSVYAAGLVTAVLFAVCLAICPFLLGIKSWTWLGIIAAPLFATALVQLYIWRRGRTIPRAMTAVVFASIGVGASAGLGGPLLVAPSFALMVTILSNAQTGDTARQRWTVLVLAWLSIAVPFALEWAGVLPEIYRYDGASLTIISPTLRFPDPAARVTLLLVDLLVIAIPTLFVWRFAAVNASLRRQLLLRQWHLQQLVPRPVPAPAA